MIAGSYRTRAKTVLGLTGLERTENINLIITNESVPISLNYPANLKFNHNSFFRFIEFIFNVC